MGMVERMGSVERMGREARVERMGRGMFVSDLYPWCEDSLMRTFILMSDR